MTLLRITMIGTLLLGFGCELPDDEQLDTDERTEAIAMEEPMSHPSDELTMVVGADSEAQQAELEQAESELAGLGEAGSDVTEETYGDEAFYAELSKVTCVYCAGNECFAASHPQEAKARERAREKCESERSRPAQCKFKGCS